MSGRGKGGVKQFIIDQKIEKLIKSNEIKRNDKILQSLSQSVQSSVAGRLEKSVKNETKNSIIPGNHCYIMKDLIYCSSFPLAIHKSLSSTQEGITRSVNEHLHQILHTEVSVYTYSIHVHVFLIGFDSSYC